MEKFTSADAWSNWKNDATEEEALKVEQQSRTLIERYEGELRVVSAQMQFDKVAASDPDFFKFIVTVETPTGDVKELMYFYSFKKFKYGLKGTLFLAQKIKSLFRALGFGELSLKDSGAANDLVLQQKFLGGWDDDGFLPKWAGLRFHGVINYKTGSSHIKKTGEVFAIVDEMDNVRIFPSIKALNVETNTFEEKLNTPIMAVTRDLVKAFAGQVGLTLSYPELLTLKPIQGANDSQIALFGPQKSIPIVPVSKLDAHSHVTEADTEDEEVAF